ncbi:ABC transporter ATP-binding protein [Sediminibacillus massiliensis]|uniref:ABC transporter ATP-binding protein n=1 Tax=Sediminibacillus massiliensis TaxID=1926277 RepID=UPI0009884E63|nr:ABC transporter ATP-binding protein [Sediminibacillus massiliensis]
MKNSQKLMNKIHIRQYFSLEEVKRTFWLLRPYIWKYKKAYFGLFFLMFVDIAITLAFAWFLGNITDAAVQSNFERLKYLLIIGVVLSAISIISNFIDTYLETVAINAVKKDVSIDLYHHVLRLPGKNLANIHSGELFSHFTNELHHIDGVAGRGLINLVRLPIISVAAFIYLVQISWKLSLFSLMIAPIAIIGGAVFGLLMRNNSRVINELISNINKSLNETFHGLTVIRSFTMEKLFYKKYINNNNKLYALELKDAKLRGSFYAGGEAVGSITFLVSLIVGAFFVSDNIITIGALLSFINLINHMVYPMTGLAGQWAGYQRSIAALERVTNLLDQPTEDKQLSTYARPKQLTNGIDIKNLSFSYDDNHNVFERFNLHIPAGKVTAFVGPSGAGKSTLFNLLQSFYKPQSGDILFDKSTIGNIGVSALRNMIAYVPQETFLFSGTVRENLMLVRPNIQHYEMVEAAKNANIHDYIASLPEGYNTVIGERGLKLSGGQRQRMAIARAILKDAPILLLDEATSALDSETEHLVKEALDRLMVGKTTLVIAHRLSTIQHADQIVVMDKGRVVQMGNHVDLISQDGLYRELNKSDRSIQNEASPVSMLG